MAPNRGRDRSGDFDRFFDEAAEDIDPEADGISRDSSDDADDFEDEVNEDGAREHYIEVGKSKLRHPKVAPLGPQYRGSRISREIASDEEDEDDPFSRGFEDEQSEDESLFANGRNGHAGQSEEDDTESDADGDDASDTDLSDGVGPEGHKLKFNGTLAGIDKTEIAANMRKDQKALASQLAQFNKADVEKGQAVKKQRAAFDALLGTRIKLQKALIGVNTVVASSRDDSVTQRDEAAESIARTEAAAFNLWSSLNDLREDVAAARAGQKRKRADFTSEATTGALWSHMHAQEESSIPHRNAILQRWSRKARNDVSRSSSGLLGKHERQATIVDTIQEHLSNTERLVKRANTPRSCAPVQLAQNITEDEKIYDDADFYGFLLKELLEQKSQNSSMASNIDLDFHLRREAKTRKNVDTKASKGRKLRYTVHEKLQNFMAPENRRTWGERQADELFKSLFGHRMGLGEANEDDEDMADDVDVDANANANANDALMLFRN